VVASTFDTNLRRGDFGDAHESTKEAITGCDNGRQAILYRAVFSGMNLTAADVHSAMTVSEMAHLILAIRADGVDKLWGKMSVGLRLAIFLKQNEKGIRTDQFDNWLDRAVKGHQIGDKDATEKLRVRIQSAKNGSLRAEDIFQDPNVKVGVDKENDGRPPKPEGVSLSAAHYNRPVAEVLLRTTTQRLTGLGECLLRHLRSHRFFQSVKEILDISPAQWADPAQLVCSACKNPALRPEEVTILAECGHIVCNEQCLQLVRRDGGMCKSSGCSAPSRDSQLLPANDVMRTDSSDVSRYGKKLHEIIELIESIKAKEEKEKVLVFVQHQKLFDEVVEVLKKTVGCLALHKGVTAATLNKFQKEGCKESVLVLNIGDESAAGRYEYAPASIYLVTHR
jgi:hypothetical protein